MLNTILYVVAAVLVLYVLIHTLREKKFNTSDALAALGVVLSLILARGPSLVGDSVMMAPNANVVQASLVATATPTPTPAPAATPTPQPSAQSEPVFNGEVGQFKEGAAFVDFLEGHADQIVKIDATIADSDFHGDISDAEMTYMVVWSNCPEALDPEEKPSTMKCVGTEINVKGLGDQPGIGYFRTNYYLKGYFLVGEMGGPSQGLMGVVLKQLKDEDVLLSRRR